MTAIDEGARHAVDSDMAAVVELAAGAADELTPRRGGYVWSRLEARSEPLEPGLDRDRRSQDALVVVGTIDEAVVGYGVIRLVALHDGAVLGRVTDVYVMPEARGVGVGEAMMGEMIDWAGRHGCVGVDSLALPGDRETKNFFETHGLVARAITVHRSLADTSKPRP